MAEQSATGRTVLIERRLADRLPLVSHVFLDPTQTPSAAGRPDRAGAR